MTRHGSRYGVPWRDRGTAMGSPPWVPMTMPVNRRSWAFTITGMGVHGNAVAVNHDGHS